MQQAAWPSISSSVEVNGRQIVRQKCGEGVKRLQKRFNKMNAKSFSESSQKSITYHILHALIQHKE